MCVAHFRVGERKELRRKNSLISQVFVFFGRLRRQKWRRIALVLDLPKQSSVSFFFSRLLLMLTWLRLAGLWAGLNNARDKID